MKIGIEQQKATALFGSHSAGEFCFEKESCPVLERTHYPKKS